MAIVRDKPPRRQLSAQQPQPVARAAAAVPLTEHAASHAKTGRPRTIKAKALKTRTASPAVAITNFSGMFRMNPLERIAVIKEGVPASDLARLAKTMGRPKERLFQVLDLPRATVDRKASANQRLSKEHSERAVGIAKLVGQVQVMVEQSGDPQGFDAARWVADWLERPIPALGGRLPAEFMDTSVGQELVSNLLLKVQSGAYA